MAEPDPSVTQIFQTLARWSCAPSYLHPMSQADIDHSPLAGLIEVKDVLSALRSCEARIVELGGRLGQLQGKHINHNIKTAGVVWHECSGCDRTWPFPTGAPDSALREWLCPGCVSAAASKDVRAAEARITELEQQLEAPGSGERFLLNSYGRRCYDAGWLAARDHQTTALRALVEKWQENARRWRTTQEVIDIALAEETEQCADELAAELPPVPGQEEP